MQQRQKRELKNETKEGITKSQPVEYSCTKYFPFCERDALC